MSWLPECTFHSIQPSLNTKHNLPARSITPPLLQAGQRTPHRIEQGSECRAWSAPDTEGMNRSPAAPGVPGSICSEASVPPPLPPSLQLLVPGAAPGPPPARGPGLALPTPTPEGPGGPATAAIPAPGRFLRPHRPGPAPGTYRGPSKRAAPPGPQRRH